MEPWIITLSFAYPPRCHLLPLFATEFFRYMFKCHGILRSTLRSVVVVPLVSTSFASRDLVGS